MGCLPGPLCMSQPAAEIVRLARISDGVAKHGVYVAQVVAEGLQHRRSRRAFLSVNSHE